MGLPSATDFVNLPRVGVGRQRAFGYVSEVQQGSNFSLYDYVRDFLSDEWNRKLVIGGGASGAVLAAVYFYQKLYSENGKPRPTSPKYKPLPLPEKGVVNENDKVVIHCNTRGYYTPSISTAAMELETFLRIAEIPYEKDYTSDYSQSEDAPLLEYGGDVANDFRECLQILETDFDVKIDKNVSSSRRTASHLVEVLLENEFSWAILIWRWIYDEGRSMERIQNTFSLDQEMIQDIGLKVKEATKHHPIGQLSREEFITTLNQGIHDIAAALGKHDYFQGQTPGVVDCHAFAILVQIMWNLPGSPFERELKKYPNLISYVNRMRENFWPDWNSRILRNYRLKRNSPSPNNARTKTSLTNSVRSRNSHSPTTTTTTKFRPRRISPSNAMKDESIEAVNIGNSMVKVKPVGILKGSTHSVNASTSVAKYSRSEVQLSNFPPLSHGKQKRHSTPSPKR